MIREEINVNTIVDFIHTIQDYITSVPLQCYGCTRIADKNKGNTSRGESLRRRQNNRQFTDDILSVFSYIEIIAC